jgi:5-hmdU DNA kinase, helical domain
MAEREKVRVAHDMNASKPWSSDWVFQQTYFCNVHRENDKVSQWIRHFYSPEVGSEWFEFNIVVSRFINKPSSLLQIGFVDGNWREEIMTGYNLAAKPFFGNAYIVSTNGAPVPKAQYLVERPFEAAAGAVGAGSGWRAAHGSGTLLAAWTALQTIDGLGSFLAAQVVADLKNTRLHPLSKAEDWMMFAAPGPGSMRGMSFLYNGVIGEKYNQRTFVQNLNHFRAIEDRIANFNICNQDLQNCLCEFDKYVRVALGAGRSKRNYNGA